MAEQLAVLEANRARRIAIEQLDFGDIEAAESSLDSASALFSCLASSELTSMELKLLAEKKALLRQDRNLSRKRLSRESRRSNTSVWEQNDNGQT